MAAFHSTVAQRRGAGTQQPRFQLHECRAAASMQRQRWYGIATHGIAPPHSSRPRTAVQQGREGGVDGKMSSDPPLKSSTQTNKHCTHESPMPWRQKLHCDRRSRATKGLWTTDDTTQTTQQGQELHSSTECAHPQPQQEHIFCTTPTRTYIQYSILIERGRTMDSQRTSAVGVAVHFRML